MEAAVAVGHQALTVKESRWRSGRQRHSVRELAGGALGLAGVAEHLALQAIETARGREKPEAFGIAHDDARRLLFSADEDFCKNSTGGIEPGYGYLRIWDYSNLAAPVQVGEYRTPNSGARLPVGSGDYTIHNPMLMGTDVYTSWYSDGVRVVDASDPTSPREVAFFVPPAGQNPVKPAQRSTLSQTPQVWGVFVDEETGLVYASDMNTGLWILRRTD